MAGEVWVKLTATWSDSDWLTGLEPAARLAWVELICRAKSTGRAGRLKKVSPAVLARQFDIPVASVDAMIAAATEDDALRVDGKDWVITGWANHQLDPTGRERQARYRRGGRAEPLHGRLSGYVAVAPTDRR